MDLIYERIESNKGFSYEKIKPLAIEVGVDENKFVECIDKDRNLKSIQENKDEVSFFGLIGTPANIIMNN